MIGRKALSESSRAQLKKSGKELRACEPHHSERLLLLASRRYQHHTRPGAPLTGGRWAFMVASSAEIHEESWSDRPRSVSLIDAQYLRAARAKILGEARFDLLEFAERIVPRFHWRFRTYYFDAPPYKDRNNPTDDQSRKFEEKRVELKTISRLDRFSVREGYCQFTKKKAKPLDHAGPIETVGIIEQKMVDVLLATEMTRIAWSKEAQHITLVAGDSDYVAAIQAAKNAGALVRLYYFREGDTSYGDRLFDEVDERFNLSDVLTAMRDKKADHRRHPAPGAEHQK